MRRPEVPSIEARPQGRRHSVTRDREAVRHHYELSNRFYESMLGPTMAYSCAYFESPADTLEAAQERKLETICRKLTLAPGERLLDVGCGWGSLFVCDVSALRTRSNYCLDIGPARASREELVYRALKFAMIVGVAWALVVSLPDLARYLRMRSI